MFYLLSVFAVATSILCRAHSVPSHGTRWSYWPSFPDCISRSQLQMSLLPIESINAEQNAIYFVAMTRIFSDKFRTPFLFITRFPFIGFSDGVGDGVRWFKWRSWLKKQASIGRKQHEMHWVRRVIKSALHLCRALSRHIRTLWRWKYDHICARTSCISDCLCSN